jgi:hypothetical protein
MLGEAPTMIFDPKKCYSRAEISAQLGGNVQSYLPTLDGRIVAGCFRRDANPGAPEVILPGLSQKIRQEAEMYETQGDAVPVFLKSQSKANCWRYVGNYRVTRRSTDAADIARNSPANRVGDVSQVLFLERVREA